jgi:hypothetical protein
MSVSSNEIDLGFGVLFDDLYNREGLVRLDGIFLHHLTGVDPSLNARLANARANPEAIAGNQRSELIIELAPHVEDFLGELFNISGEMQALGARHNALAPLFAYKRKFIQKRAISGVTKELTDAGTDLTGALDQAHYCIKCHNQGKDSCSTGLKEKTANSRKPASSA